MITMPNHYSVSPIDEHAGMAILRDMFPDGKAHDLNFAIFGTSGVHGTYFDIDDVESGTAHNLTVLIVHPRIVALRYGNIRVSKKDVPFLRALQASSIAAISEAYGS